MPLLKATKENVIIAIMGEYEEFYSKEKKPHGYILSRDELTVLEESDHLGDHEFEGLPTEPGVYRCTVEFWYSQGYFEGYPADSESDWWFKCIASEKLLDLPRREDHDNC